MAKKRHFRLASLPKRGERVERQRKHTTQQLKACMMSTLQSLSHISQKRCIFRVPNRLRDINEDSYVPRLVSIGPFHHGNASLKAMGEHKWRCFKSYIDSHYMDNLIRSMKRTERKAREFYAEPITLSSDEFVQVILVDAIFVILILLGFPVSSMYHESFLQHDLRRDMLLLENQLPLFILEELLDPVKTATYLGTFDKRSILELTRSFFKYSSATRSGISDEHSISVEQEGLAESPNSSGIKHLIDLLRFCLLPAKDRQEPKQGWKFKETKSLTELHEAGVQFKLASSEQLLDIEFKDGILEIPGIIVEDSTETIFRNLLAFEQCHHGFSYIGDYFALIDMLINTPHDVELLVKNGILENYLGNNQEVSQLFNNLGKGLGYSCDTFYYSHLCQELNDYCKIHRHKWMAALKHNYLNTPWRVVSVFAALILLILTITQTLCAIISL